jgi:hypothetical protein
MYEQTQAKMGGFNMFIRSWGILLVSLLMLITTLDLCYGSTIVTHVINSPAIAKNMVGISSLRHVLVYLPDSYEMDNYRYPVIYWIPGFTGSVTNEYQLTSINPFANGQPSKWTGSATNEYQQAIDYAIHSHRIPATIVVFIDVHEGTMFLNSSVFGNWENFMVEELIPFIDKTYRTIPNMNNRCLAGHSAGGFSAIMLSIMYPGIWGAVGTNDGMQLYPWYQIVGKDGVPDLVSFRENAIKCIIDYVIPSFTKLPANLKGYADMDNLMKIMWQFAASITRNPDSPLLADFPMNANGEWIPKVREKWREFCIMDPVGIANFLDELKRIQFTIIVAEKNYDLTNGFETEYIIEQWRSAGISVIRLDMPGLHMDYIAERFIALAESMLISLNAVPVEPKGKLTTTWDVLKVNSKFKI